MMELSFEILLAGVLAGAAPLILATMGETLTEKAGVINLSLDGTILLSAMTGFAVAYETHSLVLGFLAAGVVGVLVAAVVAGAGIYLGQSQVAVGFVLTLMCRDLAYFLGNPYSRLQGPQVGLSPLPFLKDIPGVGPVLFQQNLITYASLVLIAATWAFIYRTRWGLELRAVGEHPHAAYARGINARRVQLIYALLGGFLVGLAGAAFSLCTKPGWGRPQGAEGMGWIALAIVIFGGWHPVKVALGTYLFALLQILGITFQGVLPSVPTQVFQVAPFPLMIFTLVFMHLSQRPGAERWAAKRPWLLRIIRLLRGSAPRALGQPYRQD
ncbi:nucleoside ABC transporter membrane protein [Desulfacinum infernum DSM 9756]|uniref:Nucleoside ABC transporter membrane protein n=1 Tax=Desulfacinum infernum DSM 9756 TaxID=1121391 RepID=A0A1M5EFJ6_9BACT|nr:ABC transporter permease [Desulfacinum infernum]SHF77842.1 nucleoside ABC transporter membrane protein [Desulfacinum infernum DSM 9756]